MEGSDGSATKEGVDVDELDPRVLMLRIKALRGQLEYARDSLNIMKEELYRYWHKEIVEAGQGDPVDLLPKRLVKLLQEGERIGD